jgi:hypothetical protein
LHAYFGSVAAIYAGGVADKLSAGIAALRYVQAGRDDAAKRAAAGEPTVLQDLLAAIQANTRGPLINLVPGVFGDDSAIAAFYTEFLDGAPVVIAGTAVPDAGPPTRITLTGTTVFQQVPLTAEIVFTAPEGIVIASARYTCALSWLVDQIPWISFGTPRITLVTPDRLLAPGGSAGGLVAGTTADIAFRLPTPDGHWLLAADFAAGHFDLEDFFTVAGGVDLVRSLPAPIDGLTGIGIVNAQLLYDKRAEEVALAGFRLARPEAFTLMPGITVTDLTADVVVQRPADLAHRRTDWVVRASFAVGSGVVAIAATGPALDFTGALISGVIELDQLVDAFAPGVDISDVPSLGAVTAFSAALTPSTGDYDVSCQLDTRWEVGSSSGVYLTIESLGFTATSLSGVVTGQVDGSVLIAGTVPLSLTANYSGEQAGWTFIATQPPGEKLPLTALLEQFTGWDIDSEYSIADVGLMMAPSQDSWEVSGRTDPAWTVPFISDLSVHADFRAGSRADTSFGRIQTLWTWHGAEITVFYEFDEDEDESSFGIEWAGLAGLLAQNGSDYVVTLTLSEAITLGSMIETMVTWATGSAFALEAPWSVLNSVRLSGLALKFTFNGTEGATNKVEFAIDAGPIELGFGRIDSISVTYDGEAERKVSVTLQGSFPWNTGDGAVGTPGKLGPWDASEPGATPAPPGTGGKYVDIRMLALGQKVTSAAVAAAANVPAAIYAMSQLAEPSGDTIPAVTFDPVGGWIVGADLGFVRFGPDDGDDTENSGYLVTAQVVFNDPRLYALRIALAGPAAKVFAGLDFQIAYRQVSDSVGVYQGELALPAAMRHLNIGGYSITLPVFAVSVYTNGDFQVDVGFPWSGDFSRSLTVEAIIAPGVPVIGSGGFYFGKLSSATSDLVPAISNGTFNPVLTFGLGIQVGFGKTAEYGPLKAGFSVTAGGIVEGVLATFCPYQPSSGPPAAPAQLQEAYYFWLRGTFGVAGRLYGSVDLSVVKAEVDVSFTLMLQITYEAYAALSMTVIVAVDVSVTVRIDVGLFTIRISMSFSARIRETLTIDNGGNPPWIATGPAAARLAARRRRHVHLQEPSAVALAAAAADGKWLKLLPMPANEKIDLYGTIAPAMTAARDENNPASQIGCLVYLSFIKSVPPSTGSLAADIANAEAAADTSFELFAMMVLRWAISTILPTSMTWRNVEQEVVRETDLTYLLDVMLRSDDANPAPISPADIDFFMDGQFKFEFAYAPANEETGDLTIFPMPPSIRARMSPYGSFGGADYQLSGYNSISASGLAALRTYFDQLAVLVRDQQPAVAADPDAAALSLSMAQWVQSDYFLLVARQMVQAALDALRDYKYVLQGTQTMGQIVTAINDGGLTGADAVTIADLFAANSTRTLVPNAKLFTGASVRTPSAGGMSLEAIATTMLGSAVTATALAQANALKTGLLKTGAVVVYGQQPPYPVTSTDTLVSVAWHFGARFCDLLSGAAGLLSGPGLLGGNAELDVPLMTYQAQSTSSFKTIAGLEAYSGMHSAFTDEELALQNAGCPILRAGETVTYGQATYVIKPGDTLADAAAMVGAASVAKFLAGNPLLSSERVLADVAIVALPPFEYTVALNDTLAGIAERMATTVAVLAMAPLNAGAAVFAKTATQPWIDVPHLPKYRVSPLIDEVRRTLGIHKLASMASRYAMYGTRLPTAGIVPNAPGLWVTKTSTGGWALPPMAGLYALTGQQAGIPALIPGQVFTVDLIRPNVTPSVWYYFPNSAQLTFKLTASTEDGERFAAILAEISKPVPPDIGLQYLGTGEMVSSSPASYPLTVVANWQSPAAVRLPYGKPAGDGTVAAMRLWTLPGALTSLPDPRTPHKVAPRFAVSVAAYDEATGATVSTPVKSHGWASVVEFTVKRVPVVPGSPSTETTYEIAGAGGGEAVVLERIVAEIGADAAAFDRLVIGYPPDATTAAPTGIQTGDPAEVTFGIAQTNLSSDTRPPTAALAAGPGQAAATTGLLNSAPEFVRLLWQASITRSGGYYLYYYDAVSGAGLPERIFDDRGEAQVQLLAIYTRRGPEPSWNRVHDYMTAVITGDLIDTAASVVVATAAPDEPPLPGSEAKDLTLAEIAERSYSDLGDLAGANRDVQLETGRKLMVRHGVFQAPPGGITLLQMLSQYPTTEDALRTANPAVPPNVPALSWPLYYPRAIYLPDIEVTAGVSAQSDTLGELARHYRVALTRLAADNAHVAGLFKQDQEVQVPGGPIEATAIIAAGSGAVAARRTAPEVPNWRKPDYGLEFLRNTFSLLGYQTWDNGFFNQSNLGLPAGPVPPAEDVPAGADKVRLAAASETWEYRQSVPYYRFAKPQAGASPYQGVGKILQVNYGWQDYYGNTLQTTLDSPSANSDGPLNRQPLNRPPMLASYTDEVLGLGHWPSVSATWQVTSKTRTPLMPVLFLDASFDPSRYQGAIKAYLSGPRLIEVQFTENFNLASAQTVSNYVLDDGLPIGFSKGSAKTLILSSPSDLTNARYVLRVKGVQAAAAGRPDIYGTLTFPGWGQPGTPSSAITDAAKLDLAVYTTVEHQLNDPLGVQVTLTSPLLGEPYNISPTELNALRTWLFTAGNSVRNFLANRALALSNVSAPNSYSITRGLQADQLPAGQITELTFDYTISRTGGVVLGELDTTSSIRSATTRIPPATTAPAGSADPLGLGEFAGNFEFALATTGTLRKVATGVNRLTVSAPDPGAALWMVKVGTPPGQAISYSVNDFGNPRLFAPRPVCNKLVSRQHVLIRPYKTGAGLSDQPVKLSFADIDLDSWGRVLLDAVDDVLSPEFTAAMQIVGVRKGINRLAELLVQKGLLATAVSKLMIPLYKLDKNQEPAFVQSVYHQQLLTRLANAYDIKAGIQFRASVFAQGGGAGQPPMLFGAVHDDPPESDEEEDLRRSDITLTSPKLALEQNGSVPLPILLGAPETVTTDGAVAGSVDLTLTWRPSAIEHQIAPAQGLGAYTASSWLSFVIPDSKLDAPLGTCTVPIVLRAFPAGPVLTEQTGERTFEEATELADLTKWRYEASWSLPFHYVQDRVHGVIEFNVAPGAAAAAAPDLFDALAQFTTVYPAIKADLDRFLAPIDALTSLGPEVDCADVSLQSFVEVLAIVNAAAAGAAGLALGDPGPAAAGAANYGFEVIEGANSSGYLQITLESHGPAVVFEPVVNIPGYEADLVGEPPGLRRFIYRSKSGKYLTQAEGQQIPDRTLVLPTVDVLQRQDAWATVWVTRNEQILEGGPELADPFVYTTGKTKFSEPMLPSLESEHVIDIATIGPGGPDRTLDLHLTELFRALFADVPHEVTEVLIGAEASYLYSVLPGADPVELPIFFQPLLPVVIAKPGATLPELTNNWSDLIDLWRKGEQPVTAGARLHFDLTIFSSLTKNSMPLLRLRNLELAVADIR